MRSRTRLNSPALRISRACGTLAGLCLLAAGALQGGETVILSTGYRLHADRHEILGDTLRIWSDGGVTEMPARLLAGAEPEPDLPPTRVHEADQKPPAAAEPESATQSAARPEDLGVAAARKFGLPESFVLSVMHAESGFHPAAVSPKGAIGLMQLMPKTALELGVDPWDPAQNAEGGARYLRDLLALYEDRPDQVLLALAAYNAGPAAVEQFRGIPPYRETREYIRRVLDLWNLKKTDK